MRFNKRARSHGFTLIEVMIAIAIMVMSFGAILKVESSSLQAADRARRISNVALLAKNKMVETELEIENKSFTEIKAEESGTFDAPFEDFRWKREVLEVEFPDLVAGAAKSGEETESGEGSASDSAEMLGKMLTEHLNKSIREVKITVSFSVGEGEQSYSVSMYWVNLNEEFKIQVGG